MKKEELKKLKAVLLYIIQHSKQDRRDVYSIVKTAYYAQQDHFVHRALPLFEDRIAALPFGPVPSAMYDILKMARGDDSVSAYQQNLAMKDVALSIGFENERFYAKESADLDCLSVSDIESLNAAIEKVSCMNFDEIVADTHSQEWHRAYSSPGRHYMRDANIAREAGADESIVSYLQDSLDFSEALN